VTFETWWQKAPLSLHLARPEDIARFAFEAGRSDEREKGREKAREAVNELWHAIKAAAASHPEQYVTREFIDFCGTPDAFMRRVDDIASERTKREGE